MIECRKFYIFSVRYDFDALLGDTTKHNLSVCSNLLSIEFVFLGNTNNFGRFRIKC